MVLRNIPILSFFIFIGLSEITAQEFDSIQYDRNAAIYAFQIGLGGNLPAGDLKKRYGPNLNFSLGANYISKGNWIIVPELIYLYGDVIKEDILNPFKSKEGFLLGDDEQVTNMIYNQRGIFLGFSGGKLWSINGENRSGIALLIGGGLLAHKIKFSDQRNSFAQTRVGRSIGYDRLTRGMTLKETISYKYFSQDRRLNLEFAIDFLQGFTDEVRTINFDTGRPTLKNRMDLLHGIRIIWTLPYYKNSTQRTIYF